MQPENQQKQKVRRVSNIINRKSKGKVAILSRESDSKSLDIRMLEEELLKRGLQVRTLTKLFTKDKSQGDSFGYISHMMSQAAAMLWADVVVVDTYIIPVSMLPHTGRTKVIQMWHALSAVKKFGWQTVGSEDGSSEKTAKLMRMHKGYDYVTAPSDATAAHFAEAFRVDPSKIVKLGLPRVDYILDVTKGDGRYKAMGAVYALYPHLAEKDKTVILYAPTFRRGSLPDVKSLADALDPEKYELIVRLHPLYKAEGDLPQAEHVIYEETIPTYDLLACADAVISDYSSIVVESTIADKPLYLYTYDIDSYSRTTGLNMDFSKEAIADYVFTDAKELAAAMDKPYDFDALKAFKDKYIEVEPGRCTEQLADFIQSQIR
jgi:CDP-ribitol ribitolphosphotransferase